MAAALVAIAGPRLAALASSISLRRCGPSSDVRVRPASAWARASPHRPAAAARAAASTIAASRLSGGCGSNVTG